MAFVDDNDVVVCVIKVAFEFAFEGIHRNDGTIKLEAFELGIDKLSLLGKYNFMEVVYHRLESGGCPFEDWVDKLERRSQIAVYDYIDRVACGGSRKNVKSLGDGVWEIKVNSKHGTMRVYFGKINGLIVLLGGSKRNQFVDIKKAKDYWRSYDEQKQITQ